MARTDGKKAGRTGGDGPELAGRGADASSPAPADESDRAGATTPGEGDGHPEAGGGQESPAPAKPTLSAFAAAIERKKAAGQARSAHLDGVAKVGGATSNRKTSRTFRRKSG